MADSSIHRLEEAICGLFLIAACTVFRPLLRPWYSKWGATPAELTRHLPGDEYVPHPCGGYTQAISIKAPADLVWSWLVQIGQDKGGFYSYELLENMVGCNIHNADCILAEYQDAKVGDNLILHPKAPPVPLIAIEPGRALVYGGNPDENTSTTWTFFIDEKEGLTRLITRWVFQYKPGVINKLIYNWFLEPVAAIMQRKMLLGIKQRAEQTKFGNSISVRS